MAGLIEDDAEQAEKYPRWKDVLVVLGIAGFIGVLIWVFHEPAEEGACPLGADLLYCGPPPAASRAPLPMGGDIYEPPHNAPENVFFTEPPNDLYCPEHESREAADAEPGNRYTVEMHDKDVLVMAGGATVHIKAGAAASGTVRVCGGRATLILDGQLTGRAFVAGGGARVILVDGRAPKGPVYLMGDDAEAISCNERKLREGWPPCTRYF